MTELTELFEMNDMIKLKQKQYQLVKTKDYKTVNTLLHHNTNTWLFNTRELNKDIPCDEKRFIMSKDVMKFEFIPRR